MEADIRLDTLGRGKLQIFQRTDAFRFGADAVLLADFAEVRRRERVVDLGTGTGILPLLLYGREPTAVFDAVEILPEMAALATRSVLHNGLGESIRVWSMDMRDAPGHMGYGQHDLVVCNPPYARKGASLQNPHPGRARARHEGEITIAEIARVAAALTRNGGRAAFVFPAQRMLDLTGALTAVSLEPKRVRLVCAAPARAPYLVLLEAVRNGGRQLHWLPPLYLADAKGAQTAEIQRIYGEDTAQLTEGPI